MSISPSGPKQNVYGPEPTAPSSVTAEEKCYGEKGQSVYARTG